jgi:FtsP/CotA-like multicopper oxidase with cupredoxin domain
MDRREFLRAFLSGGALTGASAVMKPIGSPAGDAASPATPTAGAGQPLAAVNRTLDINGKAAKVFGLVREGGRPGVVLEPGQDFNVALTNELSEPTLVHWHGMTPPWPMDGVPDTPAPLMKPGETRTYAFPVADSGTYWMHAHTLQE